MAKPAEQAVNFHYDGFKAAAVEALESGDLIIEGVAANLAIDDQDEAFEAGALEEGVKALPGCPLLYHHRSGHALGKVLEATLAGDGSDRELRVKARVDKPAVGSWAEDVVNKIRRETIRGLSVAGKFRRRMTEDGWKIYSARMRELSVTPYAISPETTFATYAVKAFDEEEVVDELTTPPAESEDDQKSLSEINAILDSMEQDVQAAGRAWASPVQCVSER